MEIIPVVDLKGGCVVHACRGQRAAYRPIVSRLCRTHEPETVVRILLETCGVASLYIADLDAIGGNGTHRALIHRLSLRHPQVEFWVDAGYRNVADLELVTGRSNIVAVIGSETLIDIEHYERLRRHATDAILSLDFIAGRPLGPGLLWEQPGRWPQRLIHLDLDRVGARQGPHLAHVERLMARAPGCKVFLGGGVRHVDDLHATARAGVSGVLIATALHEGTIDPGDIAALARTEVTKNYPGMKPGHL